MSYGTCAHVGQLVLLLSILAATVEGQDLKNSDIVIVSALCMATEAVTKGALNPTERTRAH